VVRSGDRVRQTFRVQVRESCSSVTLSEVPWPLRSERIAFMASTISAARIIQCHAQHHAPCSRGFFHGVPHIVLHSSGSSSIRPRNRIRILFFWIRGISLRRYSAAAHQEVDFVLGRRHFRPKTHKASALRFSIARTFRSSCGPMRPRTVAPRSAEGAASAPTFRCRP